jgi:hypothetical protein
LAAFNQDKGNIHQNNNQLTVFHLSECLNIINRYKANEQREILLSNHDSNIASFEVSGVLHILTSIVKSNVSLKLKVFEDVICSALRIFFRIILDQQCPSNICKAYIALVLSLQDPVFHAFSEISQLGLLSDIQSVLSFSLDQFRGSKLMDGEFKN